MEGKLRINTKCRKAEFEDGLEPVSPLTEYLLTESFTLFILAVFELEISVDFSSAYYYLNHLFLNAHPRFSSIPVRTFIVLNFSFSLISWMHIATYICLLQK